MSEETYFLFAIFSIFTIVSYFIGNISPASIIGRIYNIDIRKEGSGNPGTTNVLRTLGAKAALMTFLIDIFKGVLPVIIAKLYGNEMLEYICGTAAFFGHIWPIFYRFRGGKGIATGFGVILAIDYRCGLICMVCAVLGALITKRMSCGSIMAGIALPVMFFVFHRAYIIWAICVCLIVIWKHKANIKRLIAGTEPEIGFLKK
ncbi:MAG: glycerol-3-phosphate 1-O-acyltransferase PlsY [Anaerovoracaceae bacterium]